MSKTPWMTILGTVVLCLACVPTGTQSGSGADADDARPKYGGTLNINVLADPSNWDITLITGAPDSHGVALAYDSLLSFKKGPGYEFQDLQFQPALAERWEVSPDARTFTFRLRPGAKLQNVPPVNGREVTSADVKFSAEYRLRTGEFRDKKLAKSEKDYMLEGLDQVETPDKYTAVFRFKSPFIPFISYAASEFNPILPREVYDQDGHFKDKLMGTGRFMLDAPASQKGTRWVFKRNPEYWDASEPYLDSIRWLVLPDASTSYAAFKTKQLDMLHEPLDYTAASQVLNDNPEAVSYKYATPGPGKIHLSQSPDRNSPVRDIRIRQALNLAVDRDEINKTFFGGQGEWAVPGALPGLFTPAEVRQMYRHDLEEAKRLVQQAGYPNGVTLEFPITNNERQEDLGTDQLLQAQLKKVGINVELRALDTADQRAKRRRGDFDMDHAPGGFSASHDDPDSLQFGRFYSTSSGNYAQIRDPELDKLVDAGRTEADPEKRRERLRAVSAYVVNRALALELLHPPKWTIWHPYLGNYRPNFGSRAAYSTAWMEK